MERSRLRNERHHIHKGLLKCCRCMASFMAKESDLLSGARPLNMNKSTPSQQQSVATASDVSAFPPPPVVTSAYKRDATVQLPPPSPLLHAMEAVAASTDGSAKRNQSKYDFVKVRVWVDDHFYVLSRYLLCRALVSTKVLPLFFQR
jgi:hypothetical protein